MSTLTEQKYDDETSIRFTKDDFKQQSAIERRGVKDPMMTMPIHEQVITQDVNTVNTNGSLAPIVQPAALKAEMTHLHHVTTDDRSIPSIEILGEARIAEHKPKGLGRKKLSGDPIPSQLELPGAIGEKAAEGWDAIMERAKPQIEKAQELYHAWKGEENKQIHGMESSGGHSMMDQAKDKIHDLQAAAGPMMHDIKEKATETIGLVQRKGAQTIKDLQSKRGGGEKTTSEAGEKTTSEAGETMQQRLMGYHNKMMDIWAGQEPMVRERVQQGTVLVKKYNLQLPLLALATLLTLWASISFIGWLAFPSAPANAVIAYHPQDFNSHLLQEQQDHAHMHGLHQGLTGQAFKEHEIHTGPLQDVPGPGLVDKLMLKLNSIEEKLQHSLDTIKMHGADRIGHLKESIPAAADIHMADRMGHLKDAIRNTVPNMPDIRAQVPSMPSMDQLKEKMPNMPSMDNIKAAIPTSMDALKDGVQSIKDRVNGVSGEPDNLRSGVDEFYGADLGQTPADMAGLPTHQQPMQGGMEGGNIPAHDHIMPDGRVEHVPQHQHA